MKWKDQYSVGIDEIDDQHKVLLRLFSIVQDAVATNQGWSAVHFAILETVQYAEFHFSFEEALMRLYGFPGYEEHSKAHRQILAQAEGLVGESLREGTRDDVATFFRNWLVSHMQESDRFYAKHILSGARVLGSATAD